MREYELTYLVSDDVPETELKKVTDKVAGMITGDGGKVTKEESWGRRKLAYPIGKQTFATYITVWFETEAGNIAPLDHELRVYPQVIRHLATLKVQRGEELKVSQADVVGSEAVEEILGEKSFEVVEGETEESRDLQAVRDKDEEAEEVETEEKKLEKPVKEEKLETVEEKAEAKEEKPKRTRKTKTKEETVEETPVEKEEIKEETTEKPKKTAKTKKAEVKTEEPKEEKQEDEADRIKKLDEKLDELLKDDL